MVVVGTYSVAVTLCGLSMVCWGSHANTLKMLPKTYAFPLYYWDQAIGYLLLPFFVGLTFGSFGVTGRTLFQDLSQGSATSYLMAGLGGVVFNLANILFMASIAVAGMAVAFPIGIGIALVEGVIVNYIVNPSGNPVTIFTGVLLIVLAIVLDAMAYGRLRRDEDGDQAGITKGVTFAITGGILMGLFYYLVQRSLSGDFTHLAPGKFGPYAAVVVFSATSLLSNFVFNTYLMVRPVEGTPVKFSDYGTRGTFSIHMIGVLGGVINGTGIMSNVLASQVASPGIAYGLGQGGTMVAAAWGVFFWREFCTVPKGTGWMLTAMFFLFIAGLSLLVIAKL